MYIFVKNLNEALKKNNMSQYALSKKLSIARQNVSRWCLGINEPDFETMLKICKILEVTPNYLFGYED